MTIVKNAEWIRQYHLYNICLFAYADGSCNYPIATEFKEELLSTNTIVIPDPLASINMLLLD
jgi:hypothetical protein